MMKKIIVLTTAALLTVGAATLVYAAEKDEKVENNFASTVDYELRNVNRTTMPDIMLKIMEENGYKELADEVRKGNYQAMDDFMKNISDEDYGKMIQIMKDNGYAGMANMMENIGKEGMIQMHIAMGGAASCHGTGGNFGGMMGNFQNQ